MQYKLHKHIYYIINAVNDSFINLQSNYDTFEEFFKNEDVGDWTVKDIGNWEYLVDCQTVIYRAYTICQRELYLGEFLPPL